MASFPRLRLTTPAILVVCTVALTSSPGAWAAAKPAAANPAAAKAADTNTASSKPAATKLVKAAVVTNVKTKVENRLAEAQKRDSPNLLVGKATCPAAMASVQSPAKKSATGPQTFRCTVLVEGVAAPYDVEIKDGGFVAGGSFLMSRAAAIIDVSKVISGTVAGLDAADRSTAKVTCGSAKVVVAKIGDTLTCNVDYGPTKGKQTIVYGVRDLDGTIAVKSIA